MKGAAMQGGVFSILTDYITVCALGAPVDKAVTPDLIRGPGAAGVIYAGGPGFPPSRE
jgi:hypothetical protein